MEDAKYYLDLLIKEYDKNELLEQALENSCMKLSHIIYTFESEEDPENHTNLATWKYKHKADEIKESILEEVSRG